MKLVFLRGSTDSEEYETLEEEDVLHQLMQALKDGDTVWTNGAAFWIDDAGD